MKQLILKSACIALIAGPLIAFATTLSWVTEAVRYEPALTEADLKRIRDMPLEEGAAALEARRVTVSRTDWLAESVRHRYFWTSLLRLSAAPVAGVFLACLSLGMWERRRPSARDAPPG